MLIIVQMFHILQSIPHYVHTHNVIYQYIDKFIKNILLLGFLGIIPIVKAKHSLFLSLSPPLFILFMVLETKLKPFFMVQGFHTPCPAMANLCCHFSGSHSEFSCNNSPRLTYWRSKGILLFPSAIKNKKDSTEKYYHHLFSHVSVGRYSKIDNSST